MLHILVGSADDVDGVLKAAKAGKAVPWYVPRKARPKERALIHLPGLGFAARAVIGTEPKRDSKGKYGAYVEGIVVLKPSVPLAFVRKNHPAWKWLPRNYVTIEGAIERRLNQVVDNYSASLAEELTEGASKSVSLTVYERNPEARRKCIQHYGSVCFPCGFSFGKVYGETAEGFIHVHHLKAIAKRRGEHMVDPVRDLRPVCPNCHAIIHRQDPPLRMEGLMLMLERARPVKIRR